MEWVILSALHLGELHLLIGGPLEGSPIRGPEGHAGRESDRRARITLGTEFACLDFMSEDALFKRSKVALVLNAGSGSAHQVADFLLKQPGLHIELCVPSSLKELQRFARSVSRRVDRLIVGGGDGTLSQVVRCLPRSAEVELALLPLGTGNDFARSIGIPLDDLRRAGHAALEEPAVAVDAACCTIGDGDFRFLNVANGGFGGRIVNQINPETKRVVGPAAYWLASASAIADLVTYDVRLDLDGVVSEHALLGLVVANGRFLGGGFELSPQARLDDGLLDLTLIPDLTATKALAAGARYILGASPEKRASDTFLVRRVELWSQPPMPFSIDGESMELAHAVIEVQPGTLEVVAPGLRKPADAWEGPEPVLSSTDASGRGTNEDPA